MKWRFARNSSNKHAMMRSQGQQSEANGNQKQNGAPSCLSHSHAASANSKRLCSFRFWRDACPGDSWKFALALLTRPPVRMSRVNGTKFKFSLAGPIWIRINYFIFGTSCLGRAPTRRAHYPPFVRNYSWIQLKKKAAFLLKGPPTSQ